MSQAKSDPASRTKAELQSFAAQAAGELQVKGWQVEATVDLLNSGDTVPFICRYRKEVTGGLEPDVVHSIKDQLHRWSTLQGRKAAVLAAIEKKGALTGPLRLTIQRAATLQAVEDLYQPYRPKRCTLAESARQAGLEDLAEAVWKGRCLDRDQFLRRVNQKVDKGGGSPLLAGFKEVLVGVQHILAEWVAEAPEVRGALRDTIRRSGLVTSRATKAEKDKGADASNFKDYFEFSAAVEYIKPHQALALRRGDKLKALKVTLRPLRGEDKEVETRVLNLLRASLPAIAQGQAAQGRCPEAKTCMTNALHDAWTRLLKASMTKEVLKECYEQADEAAIEVFASNVRAAMMAPPVRGKAVLGVDPGFWHGVKLAALGRSSEVLELCTVYPFTSSSSARDPQRYRQALDRLKAMVQRHGIAVIAIGNGTGSTDMQKLVAEAIAELGGAAKGGGSEGGASKPPFKGNSSNPPLQFAVVSEAGASVYSASEAAKEEFPKEDCTLLGAVSIGRRLMDPLSELVKVTPEALGLGMYQHDLPPKQLSARLDDVVRDCVNAVGVDVNAASQHLLQYVSGLNKSRAKKIREEVLAGRLFKTRADIGKVTGIGAKTYEQAAGFLRIRDSTQALDNTRVHPESYKVANRILKAAGLKMSDIAPTASGGIAEAAAERLAAVDTEAVAAEAKAGAVTVRDVVAFLREPCPDPRMDFPTPTLRQGLMRLEDLQTAMELEGTVTNVTPFGAFMDIGIDVAGLLHRSQLPRDRPLESLSVGQQLKVWVGNVDPQRRRVGLTMLSRPAQAQHGYPPGVKRKRDDAPGSLPGGVPK